MFRRTIVLAATTPVGKVSALTVTDDGVTNLFEDDDTLTVDWPTAGAVAYTAGALNLVIGIRSKPQQL